MLNRLKIRIRALFFSSKMEVDLKTREQLDPEKASEKNIIRELSPEETCDTEIRSLNDLEQIRERSWSVRGFRFAEELWQDLRYGARMLLKSPGFTATAVVALALGIGANSAIFSVINALLLRPLPYSDPDKLVQIWETDVQHAKNTVEASYPNFADWRDQNQVFEQIAGYSARGYTLTGVAEPERIQGAIISSSFFPMLRINPMLGRFFSPEEDRPNKIFSVVIG
ncbi:MAG TPA: ABC transporter permease, partial [Blastocatellia bacterium]|nr:ABC transporter permease [Blastocatellia bacterium]